MTKNKQALSIDTEESNDNILGRNSTYQAVKFNAMKHGILSRHTVLPHEDPCEYSDLLALLTHEHQPQGITEGHLVEELAGTIWRKQRVLQAEGARINQGMATIAHKTKDVLSASLPFHSDMSRDEIEIGEMLRMTPGEIKEFQETAQEELDRILHAEQLLDGDKKGYESALAELGEEDRALWEEAVDEEENEPTEEDLLDFIQENLKPWYEHQLTVASHHAEIKAQAFGEGMQTQRLVTLNRYETHLDRKFQRTLAMLIKLKELRND